MKLEHKKVMLINWLLLDVGGITTWSHQIIKGFKNIGWEADHYYCTRTGRMKISEDTFTPIGIKYKRGEKVPSKTLGFKDDVDIRYYKKLLEEYDYVIFIHASPHPTKGNLNAKGMENWRKLYTLCNKPKVVIFHDKNWHKTNLWFLDVKEHIDVILAAQHNFIESVNHYADQANNKIITDWLYFPMEIPKFNYDSIRSKKFCMLPQWIKWKNHHLLLEVADQVKYPIHFYNGGMQYHYIVKEDYWKEAINFDYVEEEEVNPDARHFYHGFVTYKKVKKIYQKYIASIDLTTGQIYFIFT